MVRARLAKPCLAKLRLAKLRLAKPRSGGPGARLRTGRCQSVGQGRRAERELRERGLRYRLAGGVRWPGLAGEAAMRVLAPAGFRLRLGRGRLRGTRSSGRF